MIGHSVSVVIRSYTLDRWHYLVAAVDSVQRQTRPPSELIIVVDHNPSLLERARQRFPSATVVENHEGQGSSGAWNSGVLAAKGQVIAFLDDDAVAAPDWLERLCAPYADDQVMGVGGHIEPLWEECRPGWFPAEFDWVMGCSYRGLPEGVAPIRNLIGCNMSLRRVVFEQNGGFRQGMGHRGRLPFGCEETELCIRVRQQWPEKVLLYNPQARVYHNVTRTRSQWRYFRTRCYLEGRSKALVARYVGTGDGLASERAHALRTLPQGMMRNLRTAVRQANPSALARAGAILAGLGIASVGYLAGSVLWALAASRGARNEIGVIPGVPQTAISYKQ